MSLTAHRVFAAFLLVFAGAAYQLSDKQTDGPGLRLERIAAAPYSDFSDVQFTAAGVGWGVGSERKLWRSEDGGVTWAEVNLPACGDSVPFIGSIRLWSPERGYIFYCGRVLLTSDAGRTWKRFPLPDMDALAGELDSVWVDSGLEEAWAGGSVWRNVTEYRGGPHWAYRDLTGSLQMSYPVLLHTKDGGVSWKRIGTM